MRSTHAISIVLAVAICLSMARAQSLGDVAREQRQRQQDKDPHTATKVITDEDIPDRDDDSDDFSNPTGNRRHANIRPASSVIKTGEQFKAAILARKHAIAALQIQVDKLNASIHFVEANLYRNGIQYNQRQAQKQEDVLRLQ